MKQVTRTIDSYLLNRRDKYARVYVDEVIMAHAGNIVAVAYFSGATEVICLGDTAQIPFISRTPSVTAVHQLIAPMSILRSFWILLTDVLLM